jgi:hypothetical protein
MVLVIFIEFLRSEDGAGCPSLLAAERDASALRVTQHPADYAPLDRNSFYDLKMREILDGLKRSTIPRENFTPSIH